MYLTFSFFCICLCHSLFFGQVMSPLHSEQMSQRSQVPRIALWKGSLNVFVFVIVFVFVFVFVIFGRVISPNHFDQISQRSQVSWVFLLQSMACLMFQNQKWLTQWVSDKVTYWAVGWTAKNRTKMSSHVLPVVYVQSCTCRHMFPSHSIFNLYKV